MTAIINGSSPTVTFSDGTTQASAGLVVGTASAITSGTAVASTSGTNIDFTGIPSWAKRITVMYSGVSVNASTTPMIQLGTAGGAVSTGYVQAGLYTPTSGFYTNGTTGFGILGSSLVSSSNTFNGSYIFSLLSNNTWTGQGIFYVGVNVYCCFCAGTVPLGGALTFIRNTTLSGTASFSAGTINIFYE
jgi:hypothetical protein